MKTVIIPTCANPFVVIVNGIKYTYPAGETMEVPDDVAAVIEQHDVAHSKHEPAPVVPPFAPGDGVDDVTLAAAKAYTDKQRLAYEEVKRDYLIDNLSFAGLYWSSVKYPEGTWLTFDENKVYHLTFNGETYSNDCFMEGQPSFYVRHPADNNIMARFIMMSNSLCMYDSGGIEYDWANSGLSFSLYTDYTEIHTIDPKFTPGVLPSMTLNRCWSKNSDGLILSEEESQRLDEIAKSATPFILTMYFGEAGYKRSWVMNIDRYDNGNCDYYGNIIELGGYIYLTRIYGWPGTWRFYGEEYKLSS